MTQRAYDEDNPNGTARRKQGDRVPMILRLYRRRSAGGLPDFETGGFLGGVRQVIRDARQLVRDAVIAPLNGGLILEREYRFVLIIEGTDDVQEVRTRAQYTKGGFYTDTTRKGLGFTNFRVSGRAHWTPVLVNGVPVDGDAALKELQELIQEYFDPGGTLGGVSSEYELRWFNFLSPISADDPFGQFEWVIHPKRGIELRQQADRPLQRFFSFEFWGLESNRDRATAEDGFLAGLFARSGFRRLLEAMHLGALADGIDAVFGTVAEFQGLLDDLNLAAASVQQWVTGAQDAIKYSIAKVRGLLSSMDELAGRVEGIIDDLRDLPNLVEDQIELLRQTVPGIKHYGIDPETGENVATDWTISPLVDLDNEIDQVRNFLLGLLGNQRVFSDVITSGANRTVKLSIPIGSTLTQLAAQSHSDPDEIIRLNKLSYPYVDTRERPDRKVARIDAEIQNLKARDNATIAAGGVPVYASTITALTVKLTEAQAQAVDSPAQPGVLYAYDSIRIPSTEPRVTPSIIGAEGNFILASGEPVDEEERIFGIDMLLNAAGDLEWDADAMDLKLVRGLDCVTRALDRYVKVPLGQLRFAPGIGNFAFEDLASWQGPGQGELLVYYLWRTLSQDPRIQTISNMRAVTQGGVSRLEYHARLINGQALPDLRVPLEQ